MVIHFPLNKMFNLKSFFILYVYSIAKNKKTVIIYTIFTVLEILTYLHIFVLRHYSLLHTKPVIW